MFNDNGYWYKKEGQLVFPQLLRDGKTNFLMSHHDAQYRSEEISPVAIGQYKFKVKYSVFWGKSIKKAWKSIKFKLRQFIFK